METGPSFHRFDGQPLYSSWDKSSDFTLFTSASSKHDHLSTSPLKSLPAASNTPSTPPQPVKPASAVSARLSCSIRSHYAAIRAKREMGCSPSPAVAAVLSSPGRVFAVALTDKGHTTVESPIFGRREIRSRDVTSKDLAKVKRKLDFDSLTEDELSDEELSSSCLSEPKKIQMGAKRRALECYGN